MRVVLLFFVIFILLFYIISITSKDIDYISYKNTSKETFFKNYEKRSKPCVILDGMDTWKAKTTWNPEYFKKQYKDVEFLAGYYEINHEDDKETVVQLSYDAFSNLTKKNLYIFDPDFGERASTTRFLDDYEILDYFTDDTFAEKIQNFDDRPPFRWMLIGTNGSGGTLHTDPLGTSAWNALFYGQKLWILFPPNTPIGPGTLNGERWLKNEYPKIKHHKHIRLIQNPGEIVFVPAGWWHTAVNIGDTFAVTQNYLHPHHISFGLDEMHKHTPELLKYF